MTGKTPQVFGDDACFSMFELLVTVLLAGVIFAAMVPVFTNALRRTSVDNFRVTAVNIAQDRIEKIRMLNYMDVQDSNLNDPAFADGEFGGSFRPTGSSKTFTMNPYEVTPSTATDPHTGKPVYKTVVVSVSWGSGPHDSITMQTVVMNPDPVITGSTPTPTTTPSPGSTTGTNYTLGVFCTDNTVTSNGVTVVRTDVTPNIVQSPKQIPNLSNGLSVYWTGLVGGPSVKYKITVYFQVPGHSAESKSVTITMLDDYPVYFDTNPYQ
jgi:Tfp pilus assembly protein PilV